MDLLDRLVGHDHWATAGLLELTRNLTDAQLDQPFDIGHRTLRATFEHMILNVEFWTTLMAEQPVKIVDFQQYGTRAVQKHGTPRSRSLT